MGGGFPGKPTPVHFRVQVCVCVFNIATASALFVVYCRYKAFVSGFVILSVESYWS
jgi:hypothetical protein